ncbi:MAG: hypothetical protein CBD16_00230 [Betaproteobacteria bacterium TMED156]|nr:MAG: hypothetical protein CBD16_00230 [Betaproteobacteria bacterium TMED156]
MKSFENFATIKNDSRVMSAIDWINTLNLSKNINIDSIRPASEDASFRRYFRINFKNSRKSLILMDSPPEKEPLNQFLYVSKIFLDAKIKVPKIFEENELDGFLLIEDFGIETYLNNYNNNPDSITELIEMGCNSIIKLQSWGLVNDLNSLNLPIFTKDMLLDEAGLFDTWFLKRHLKINLKNFEKEELTKILKNLCKKISTGPKVIVHRDFHSRNLMFISKEKQPGILDFQDAVLGPISYDLASLIRDAYYNWDYHQELIWTKQYWEKAKKENLLIAECFGEFWNDFELNSIQRHLKVMGIFCRLAYRDKKKKYLNDLKRVRNKCLEILLRHNEFEYLAELLAKIEKTDKKSEI